MELCRTIKKIIEDDKDDMIVSIKDIEDTVEVLSNIISKSINIAIGVD